MTCTSSILNQILETVSKLVIYFYLLQTPNTPVFGLFCVYFSSVRLALPTSPSSSRVQCKPSRVYQRSIYKYRSVGAPLPLVLLFWRSIFMLPFSGAPILCALFFQCSHPLHYFYAALLYGCSFSPPFGTPFPCAP